MSIQNIPSRSNTYQPSQFQIETQRSPQQSSNVPTAKNVTRHPVAATSDAPKASPVPRKNDNDNDSKLGGRIDVTA